MKMIKFKTCCALMGASLFITPGLFAQIVGTGSLYITAPSYSNDGDQAGPYLVQNLTVSTGVNPGSTFETFCIGSHLDYFPNTTYTYQISDIVEPGSIGGPGFVTWGTAYLYSQFLAGAIGVGANPANFSISNPQNDALQVAIWDLQEQSTLGITFNGTVNQTVVNQLLTDAANAAKAAGISSDSDAANGAFGVYALNMSSDGTYVQPQLVMIPAAVPEANTVFAGAVMLVPLGLSALRLVRTLRTRREA
jgi:hypothetical protein